MVYVAVDKDGAEHIFQKQPCRDAFAYFWFSIDDYVELPKGSIKKLIGRELTWDDEPVELK